MLLFFVGIRGVCSFVGDGLTKESVVTMPIIRTTRLYRNRDNSGKSLNIPYFEYRSGVYDGKNAGKISILDELNVCLLL